MPGPRRRRQQCSGANYVRVCGTRGNAAASGPGCSSGESRVSTSRPREPSGPHIQLAVSSTPLREGRSDETEGVGRLPQAGSLHRKLHQLSIVPCVLTFFSDALVQAKNAAARAGTPGRAGRLGPQATFAAGVLGLRGQLTLPPAPPPASPSCALSPHPLTLAVHLSRTLAFTCLHPSCPEYGCGPVAKDHKPGGSNSRCWRLGV